MATLHPINQPQAIASKLRVLDLFAGAPPHGWSAAFRDRGHEIVTLDWEQRFGADLQIDILALDGIDQIGRFDVILASPPCETFSVASIGHHWTGGRRAYQPRTDACRRGLAIMRKTFALIEAAAPPYYVIENPRGVMRKLAPRAPTATTWFCQWGESRAKPTDLWTNVPMHFPPVSQWRFRPRPRAARCEDGDARARVGGRSRPNPLPTLALSVSSDRGRDRRANACGVRRRVERGCGPQTANSLPVCAPSSADSAARGSVSPSPARMKSLSTSLRRREERPGARHRQRRAPPSSSATVRGTLRRRVPEVNGSRSRTLSSV